MFVDYHVARSPELPAMPACLYRYVLAGNGIFVQARKPGMEAMIHWAGVTSPVSGLAPLLSYLHLFQRIPVEFTSLIYHESCNALPNEILFWLHPYQPQEPWKLLIPHQRCTPGSVHPVDPYHPASKVVYVEVHSHNRMKPFFSDADNRDETGFKVYAVIGTVDTRPTILCRVGIYGHFQLIPASWVFELPPGIFDGLGEAYARNEV